MTVGVMSDEEYEFNTAIITKKDVIAAIEFLQKAEVYERDILYYRHAITALKFLVEVLS